jgi:putative peptidoglycan lipid II flippase
LVQPGEPQETNDEATGKPRRGVARSAGIIGLAVLSSRLLGLVREQVFAAFFGAGAANDAFVVAFRIPNLFRDLLAEGALSTAFVKVFSARLVADGKERAFELASRVFTALALVVATLCVLGTLAAPVLVDWMAPGFDGGKRSLTVELTRLMFPFLLLVALAAVAMGTLNARGVFGIPAMASTYFNAGSIACGIFASWWLAPEHVEAVARALLDGEPIARDGLAEARAIFGMAYGVLAGGLLQFLCQLPALRREGFRYRPRLGLRDPGLREVAMLMGPAILGAAAVQINVFVNNNFASRLGGELADGGVSVLNYAFRLMQFPIGVFGVAIATATLPAISRAAARQDRDEYRATLASSLRFVIFLTLPSAVGLAVLGEPIVALIYERGQFDAAATRLTASALACYAIGLTGYSLVKVLAPAFYVVDDARTPARIALLSIGINLGLNFALVEPLQHRGLALSTSLVATLNAALLFELLRRRIGSLRGGYLLDGIVRVALASLALAAASHAARLALEGWFPAPDTGARAIVVFGSIGAGFGAFVIAAVILRIEEARRFMNLVTRGRDRARPPGP